MIAGKKMKEPDYSMAPANLPDLNLMSQLSLFSPPMQGGMGFLPGFASPYADPAFYQQQQAMIAATASRFLAAGINPMFMFAPPMLDPYTLERAGGGGIAGGGGGGGARGGYHGPAVTCEPTCTWSGSLPCRNYKNPMYSCKIFVGGVPWDITEEALLNAFKPFGPVRVEWPGKEARYQRSPSKPSSRGYVYMIFENEKSIRSLLENCSQDFGSGGDWYFKLTARRMRTKEIRQVQVIPWVISDSNYVRCPSQRLDPKKTVFVGALHGMVTAEILANIMNDLFGGVVYAGIDTDKYKYPIGSGRVTFNSNRCYLKAINSAYVEIKTPKFAKKVQIDPFLEDSQCSICRHAAGPYFCREPGCFNYYCRNCWQSQHGSVEDLRNHKPLMRNTRRAQPSGEGPSSPLDSPGGSSSSGGSYHESCSPPAIVGQEKGSNFKGDKA